VISLLAVHPLATTNAVLNSLAALLLVAGWVLIRRGRVRAHRNVMMAAFATSAVFLVSYLTYHYLVGHVPFRGQGPIRIVYFTILISHILLAVTVPVLAISMFVLAWRRRWTAHRRLGRVTMPIWLYVSVTGVVVYFMLYG
jgi:putative membrane protein